MSKAISAVHLNRSTYALLPLEASSSMQSKGVIGSVAIIGAGPGDPELLTVKAVRFIEAADVIMYDRLVSKEILQYAKAEAELIYCGKAPGQHAMTQADIHKALIHYAYQGKRVVRLKGGDPFIFGRGGEEALELAAAGIEFEIIPGITSAIGAAASASIPMTHRGTAASFACVTGNRCHDNHKPVRWDLLAHSVDTLAIYMGVSQLSEIQAELLRAGKPAATPIAFVEQGTTAKQRIVTGVLGEMSELAAASKLVNPALIIIGEVVRIREQLHAIMLQALTLRQIG
ncbi:uroporphyrin-III C-methyltransferase [Paenibacillus montaniterrae]|uniref:Uroporphyrinogen-III C-methyltransferase n=1 Tax=Paenibacillus montaniterrae TaxID=429341 RepID=A0A919YS89_9BACL|nr:uroporphyrin-III C-methyltransferase [Paenibacillus montaniterrae]